MMFICLLSLLLVINQCTSYIIRYKSVLYNQLKAKKYDSNDFINISINKPLGLSLEEVESDGNKGLYIEDIDDGNAKKTGKLYKGLLLISANGVDVKSANFDAVMDILVNAPIDKPLDLTFIDPRKVEKGPAIITVITPDKKEIIVNSLKGQNLRSVLLGSSIDIYSSKAKFTNCAGAGQCGTCVIRLSNDIDWETRSDYETKKLKKYDSSTRLSCLTTIEGDCIVEIQPEKIAS